MATLFFSYSHKDESLRDELEVHFAVLKHDGAIDSWHDRRIPAGDSLDGSINEKLEAADIILLLVSPDFLDSRYCYDVEFRRAFERHHQGSARIIPVILRPCDWQSTPLGGLMAVPRDGKPITKWPDRDEAFLDVVQQIRAALPKKQTAAPVLPPAHYPAISIPPRSSNLRLRKQFIDADKDRFLDESFEFIARFFEGSLEELGQRNEGIEGRFKRVDAQSFTAVIYRNGKSATQCMIQYGAGRGFGSGITFSSNPAARGNSFNESLSVEVGEQALSLKAMGMRSHLGQGPRGTQLSMEGAAEYYWSMLIEPLQR